MTLTPGLPFPERVKWIARDLLDVDPDIVLLQEAGRREDARAVATALGAGWASHLRGDDRGDITEAVLWASAWVMEAERRLDVGTGSHQYDTAVKLLNIPTGQQHARVSVHMPPKAAAAQLRARHGAELVEQVAELADDWDVPLSRVIIGGDWNDVLGSTPLGKVLTKAGWVTAQSVARKVENGSPRSTLNDEKRAHRNGVRYDEFVLWGEAVESGDVVVERHETGKTWPGSDHQDVAITTTHR